MVEGAGGWLVTLHLNPSTEGRGRGMASQLAIRNLFHSERLHLLRVSHSFPTEKLVSHASLGVGLVG